MNVIKDRVIKSREFISLAAALIIDWIIASLCKIHVLLVDAMFNFIFFLLLLSLSMAIMRWMMPRCWKEWNEILISHKIMRFQIVLLFASSCKGNFVFKRNYYIFFILEIYVYNSNFFFSIIQLLCIVESFFFFFFFQS